MMNTDLRMQLQIARTGHYGQIMQTTLFGLIAVAAIIAFSAGGADLPLILIVIAVSAYGILAGGTALDDIAKLRDDMDAATAGSTYGKQAKARNLGLLKSISAALVGLSGLAEIAAILMR